MSAAFTAAEVLEALDRTAGPSDVRFSSVSTDTRTMRRGALFVALAGEHSDGFQYLTAAVEAGARGAIVPSGRELPPLDLHFFPVPDTREALGRLAAYHRQRASARVVAITGSSGKTTVKEMVRHAIGGVGRVHATRGNENNQIGLPLSILSAPSEAEVWVLELGSNAPGEIARLADIARPHDAVVTTVGPAHLEGFGDEAGVLREKLALVEAAAASGSVVVGERPLTLPRGARRLRPDTRVAGLGPEADFTPDRYESGATRVAFERGQVRYRIAAGGEHMLRDALIAAAVAEALGIEAAAAAGGLAGFEPLHMRGGVRQLGSLTVIDDSYNANPESFQAAIDYCTSSFPDRPLAAIVGSMLELGDRSRSAHLEVARLLVRTGFLTVAATGEFADAFQTIGPTANGTHVVVAENPEDAWEPLVEALAGDEVVLVKGSRGAHLERIVERLVRLYGRETGS